MRHRYQTPASKDAQREAQARAQLTRAMNRMEQTPMREAVPPRQVARIVVEVDGQRFEAEGKPGRRCNRFNWTINGTPWKSGGLEALWREIQRRRVPMLGARNLGDH